MAEMVVNHVGLCVTDLARSVRFYTEAFGFQLVKELPVPDQGSGKLLQIEPPIGLTAAYLTLGEFVLELMVFEREGNPPHRARVPNEPGLTHLSIGVDDVAAAAAKVEACGGEVLRDTDVRAAVLVRDPDGQMLELLDLRSRPVSPVR